MKGYALAARALHECGADTLFGLMGDANMAYIASFIDNHGGRYVAAVHEGGAVSMADGYSRMSQRVGIASVTHGPAVTNTITALIEAVRAHRPVVLISGDTPPERNYWQRLDLEQVAALTGADFWRVLKTEHIVNDVAMVLARVAETRRPLILDIPISLMNEDADYQPSNFKSPRRRQIVQPGEDALDDALGVIASSRRPVILAGHGAVLSGAKDALIALADVLGAPLATTVLAKDMFRGHPRDIGFMGTLSSPRAIDAISSADCLIAFGAGMNSMTTDRGGLLQNMALVRCDIAPEALDHNVGAQQVILGDARAVAEAMLGQLTEAGFTMNPAAGLVSESISEDSKPYVDQSGEGTVDMRVAMERLDGILPADRVIVSDSGRFAYAPWKYLHVSDPADFTQTCGNWASIGLGVATAVGAAAAIGPERLTVGIIGDGGGMMGIIEFTTAVRSGLPLVLVVLNDSCYGAEWTKLENYGLDPLHSCVAWPEFAELGVAMGGDGITVRKLEDLDVLPQYLANLSRPLIVDIKCDPKLVGH